MIGITRVQVISSCLRIVVAHSNGAAGQYQNSFDPASSHFRGGVYAGLVTGYGAENRLVTGLQATAQQSNAGETS